jgi:enterochelin esterase-like enzyme
MLRRLPLLSVLALAACGGAFERQLDYTTTATPSIRGEELTYAVYTPPGYEVGERLPLVLFLHGGGDDASSFDRHGVTAALNEATATGVIPRVIVALPEGQLGFWADWHDGSHNYESWAVDEVLATVAHRYETLPCPDYCHVMGVSMGGSGTLRFALHRPDRFASATIISAPIFDTDAMVNFARAPLLQPLIPVDRIFGPPEPASVREDDPFLRWDSPDDVEGLRLMVAWGTRDRGPIVASSRRFHAHLTDNGVPHETLEFEGNHSWASWTPVIQEALRRMVPPSPWAQARAASSR